MEHFVVSARKYRPQTFKDVVGQQAITNTLLNAIEHNHLAQALLFTGPRGVGKTTCARILAKKINQEESQDPNEDFAFNIFELDAASNNSVDDIRNLIDQVRIPPQVGKYKVYIIDEVHMLSQAAFNAFLKTLEEPPKHAIFILATTEKHKIIPTILSRCQIFDFKRITVQDAKEYLAYIAQQEGVSAEDDALHIIAQKADGAMRDALSIYDRVVSFSGKELTRQAVTENLNVLDYDTYLTATDLILQNDIPQLLLQYNEILSLGFDGHHFIAGLASHFRNLLVCQNPKTINLLEVGDNTKAQYYEQAQKASAQFLLKGIELANECDLQYKSSRNQRLLVELCLMQLASVTFGGEKKNDNSFIIPPSHFSQPPVPTPAMKLSPKEKEVITSNEYGKGASAPPQEAQLPQKGSATSENCAPETAVKEPEPDISSPSPEAEKEPASSPTSEVTQTSGPSAETENRITKKKVSGLSLKSIQKKKELEAQKREAQKEQVIEKNGEFTEKEMQEAWQEFAAQQIEKGEKILASIMQTDTPVLKGKDICIELPNETMKLELERVQYYLMGFLKDKLQNTHIQLKVKVNEKAEKKFAFTPIEKFQKLQEKNPLLEKLRATFDLDI
ncbi:DNA polymerase-3 subunit gamma/tau [Salinimicrobium catena]|uniref:DNA polymerase III subunit gamma/tau n=1 Tax=Salinimicrobium catena TaxID=390640 RepID=A0A1H5KUJ9_9FLAO|nr:DNA polymerase III subunit gamma/tau [Salinimicrobium catena]SDL01861.1 DNA polymerase-3 subunit gamma/tau [Salinimicrobium catena]SEE68380.1 DNA polymerase-3 subunit gamma/tau [Salinimicrobium catena]